MFGFRVGPKLQQTARTRLEVFRVPTTAIRVALGIFSRRAI